MFSSGSPLGLWPRRATIQPSSCGSFGAGTVLRSGAISLLTALWRRAIFAAWLGPGRARTIAEPAPRVWEKFGKNGDALLNRAGRKWYGGTGLGMVVSSLSCVARGQLRTASRLNVAPAESVPYGFLFSVPQCGIEKMAYRVYSQCLSYARRPV